MPQIKAKPIGHPVHSFEISPELQISRSAFNRSHSLITSMNADYLIPIWHDLAYPGDTLKLSCRAFSRLSSQIVPFMDNMYMDVHFWCVPIRLVWSHWQNFMGENPAKYDPSDPLSGTDYLTPQITTTSTSDVTAQSIYDYFGTPLGISGLSFNAFKYRSYNLVWNEDYRDENLQDPVIVRLGDNGTDLISDYTLLKRGKRKDYFTGALPFPQKGPAVDLPLGTTAPVYGDGSGIIPISPLSIPTADYMFTQINYPVSGGTHDVVSMTNPSGVAYGATSPITFTDNKALPAYVDLTNATASTINGLRQAFALQRFYEKDARGGTRYIEMILSHFGVKSPDARLQRPEFLGGGTFSLNTNIVPQTSATVSGTTPQANLSAYSVINGQTKEIVHSFTEHCIVFGLASIRADLTYQQGLERQDSYRSRTDFYFPSFANLGEQAILNKEIFAQGSSVVDSDGNIIDNQVFGYIPRYDEMRHKMNRITGMLRSDANLSLDVWHLAEDFSSLPALNASFIVNNTPVSRVQAVTGAGVPQFISNFWFDETWIRPMPVYSIPSMSSHF